MTTIIKAQNINRAFGQGELEVKVLNDVSLEIKEGEFVAIMGKSGAGKSTLMYQLSVLDTPTSGTIEVADTEVTTLSENEKTSFRLATLGYIFQDYALVPDLSARENVMMPLLMRGESFAVAKEKADKALDEVGLKDKYQNLPYMLSGGEQQRVAVARAVASTPKIIFADEPTANLDSVSGQNIIDLLTKLNRDNGQTIVMVTHEREYADNVHRIIAMEDGRIVREEILKELVRIN